MKIKNRIIPLAGVCVVLAVLFIISFPIKNSKNKRESVKSALINPKYKDQITEISIYDTKENNKNGIVIYKENEYWFVKDITNSTLSVPCNSEKINSLMNNLTNISNMYKISDSDVNKSLYGLTSPDTIHIKYSIDNVETNEILFGNLDFSQTSRYIMPGGNISIFEIDSSLEQYLNYSLSLWTEPYIISKVVTNNIKASDIQSIKIQKENQQTIVYNSNSEGFSEKVDRVLELRHGGICYDAFESNPVFTMTTENGDGSEIIMRIYNISPNNYCTHTQYKPSIVNKDKTVYSFYTKISQWTYNSILESF